MKENDIQSAISEIFILFNTHFLNTFDYETLRIELAQSHQNSIAHNASGMDQEILHNKVSQTLDAMEAMIRAKSALSSVLYPFTDQQANQIYELWLSRFDNQSKNVAPKPSIQPKSKNLINARLPVRGPVSGRIKKHTRGRTL